MECPCGSQKNYDSCCEPIIKGAVSAPTAEVLMRARYSAHVKAEVKFIKDSLAPEARRDFDEAGVREWSKKSEWLGLQVLSVKQGLESDKKGTVEFVATYKVGGKTTEHHEVAQFRKDPSKNQWVFVDGDSHTHEGGQGHHHHHEPIAPVVRAEPKVGRNDVCPCGSGKKYKKCHGA